VYGTLFQKLSLTHSTPEKWGKAFPLVSGGDVVLWARASRLQTRRSFSIVHDVWSQNGPQTVSAADTPRPSSPSPAMNRRPMCVPCWCKHRPAPNSGYGPSAAATPAPTATSRYAQNSSAINATIAKWNPRSAGSASNRRSPVSDGPPTTTPKPNQQIPDRTVVVGLHRLEAREAAPRGVVAGAEAIEDLAG
jgi:hypothetical protein